MYKAVLKLNRQDEDRKGSTAAPQVR
jgi:hypothetical protein